MKTKYKIILITQSIIIAGLVIFSYSMFETISQVLPSEDGTVEDTELQPKDGVLTKVEGLQYESPEELAHEFVKFFDDEIIGIAHQNENRIKYETKNNGFLSVQLGPRLDSDRVLSYEIYGDNAYPKEKIYEIFELINEFLHTDVTNKPIHYETVNFGNAKEIKFAQKKDGWIIYSQSSSIRLKDDYTSINLGNWYSDLDFVKINYSQEDAIEKANQYAKTDPAITEDQRLIDCKFKAGKADSASLEIVHDRLVYAVSSGNCEVEAWEGHHAWIQILVNAHTGEVFDWRWGTLE